KATPQPSQCGPVRPPRCISPEKLKQISVGTLALMPINSHIQLLPRQNLGTSVGPLVRWSVGPLVRWSDWSTIQGYGTAESRPRLPGTCIARVQVSSGLLRRCESAGGGHTCAGHDGD